jgi:preprotein translocase subunit YajC
MNQAWIIAQADSNQAPSRVGSGPVSDQGQTPTTTTTQSTEPNATGNGPVQQKPGFPYQLVFLVLMIVIFYVFILRGPRKQQQQHKQMVQTLKKNDRVRTIGGIMGTVVDVRGDEVTLKVDESNNTKLRVSTSAIGKNLSQENKE